jgi:hypothetical protein
MTTPAPQDPMQMITRMLQPWQAALENPPQAQESVLQGLLKIYAQTLTDKNMLPSPWDPSPITGRSSLFLRMRITSP